MYWRLKLKPTYWLSLIQRGIAIFILCGIVLLFACQPNSIYQPRTRINPAYWYNKFNNATPNAGSSSLDSAEVSAFIRQAQFDALLIIIDITPYKCSYNTSVMAYDSQYCYLRVIRINETILSKTGNNSDSTSLGYSELWVYDRSTEEQKIRMPYPEP